MITVYYLLIVVFVLSQRRVLRSFFLSLTPLSLSARHKPQVASRRMRHATVSAIVIVAFTLSLSILTLCSVVESASPSWSSSSSPSRQDFRRVLQCRRRRRSSTGVVVVFVDPILTTTDNDDHDNGGNDNSEGGAGGLIS